MVNFQTKNPNLGKFLKVLQRKMLGFFMAFSLFTAKWYILWPFGTIWYIFPHFGTLHSEKSGNPDSEAINNFAKKSSKSRWKKLLLLAKLKLLTHFFGKACIF
jgi:hypothetical protein